MAASGRKAKGRAAQRDSAGRSRVEREDLVEAPLIVLIAVGLQLVLGLSSLSQEWSLWFFPGWVWLLPVIPELVLIGVLSTKESRRHSPRDTGRRPIAIALTVVVLVANLMALVALIVSLVTQGEAHAGSLLLKGLTIWGTNVVAFGLLYWELDGGGPFKRLRSRSPRERDFRFPQQDTPKIAPRDWQPALLDYTYVALTNSIAFSPTDTMPLTHRAKLAMAAESILSAVAVLLVISRAVAIF